MGGIVTGIAVVGDGVDGRIGVGTAVVGDDVVGTIVMGTAVVGKDVANRDEFIVVGAIVTFSGLLKATSAPVVPAAATTTTAPTVAAVP